MRVLLTFAGLRDPFNPDTLVAGSASDGPVLTLLAEERFDRIYVFSDERLISNARNLLDEIRTRRAGAHAEIVEVSLPDPTDHEEIFSELNRRTRVLRARHRRDRAKYFVSIASGTPQMSTVWFLLVQSGLLPATLLKVTPRTFLKTGQRAVSEIRLSLKEFPKVTSSQTRAVEVASLKIQKERLEAERESFFGEIDADGIVGTSRALREALAVLKKAALTEHPILILGESGTGKELFARAAHRWSPRRHGPFITINCAAMPETLIESELFGHERGAFTGAIQAKRGTFELAHSGTLFLDEVGELSLAAQAKLLRAVERGELEKLGTTKQIRVDVRVIAATNRDLKQAVADKHFREDLYYRLSAIAVMAPALRDRRDDIRLLLEHFLRLYAPTSMQPLQLSADALRCLLDHPWPGNVRELENAVRHGAALALPGSVIGTADLPQEIALPIRSGPDVRRDVTIPPHGFDLRTYLRGLEKDFYARAIELHNGNRAGAAAALGIDQHAFRKRARTLGL